MMLALLLAILRTVFALLIAHGTPSPAATLTPAAPVGASSGTGSAAHGTSHPTGTAPAPGRVAPPRSGARSLDNSAPTSGGGADVLRTPPGPDSPVCLPGQTSDTDGCAQGQLPEETIGRVTG